MSADQRIAELLDRWLASVDLHAKYLELDAEQYSRVQDWPKHQRPTRWVVELARARLIELKRHLDERRSANDASFAESLELMAFLTTLLGSEHIDRFIPLATGKAPAAAPQPEPGEPGEPPEPPTEPRKSTGDTTTKQKLAVRARPAPATGHGPRAKAAPAAPKAAAPKPKSSEKVVALVVADAVRFLSWGREWPQLASSISRLADRPAEPEILAILRAYRTEIEAKARRPPD